MGTESKGRAWFGKIYNKLERILVEVDTFTSQSTLCLKSCAPPGLESVRGEPKEVAEDHSSGASNLQEPHDRVASPSCKSPSDPPSHQNFDISGHVQVEERVHGDILKENLSASSFPDGEILSTSPLLEEYCDVNLTPTTTLGDEEPIITGEESQILPDGELLSTSPLLEQYHDTNLTSVTTIGDEEPIVTDEESQFLPDGELLSTSPLLEEYHDANLTSATTIGDKEPIVTDEESQITLTRQKFSDEPKEVAEDRSSRASIVQQHHDTVASPSCKSPSDPPSHQNFDVSGHVRVEEQVQGDILKENLVQGVSFNENLSASSLPDEEILSTSPLLEEYCDASLASATTFGDEEQIITDEESQITSTFTPQKFSVGNSLNFPGEEIVEEVRVESCGDVVSTESQSTQSSLETFGTVVECNDDPTLAALGFLTDDSNLNPIATKIADAPVQDNVANMRSSNADDVINGKSDVAPSDTNALYDIEFREDPSYVDDSALYAMRARIIALLDANALYGMEFREDPSYVDDSALYAMRLRTKKLRSFKRKILDALTSKRRREKEYEQLAIWFGDADMGSDLATEEDIIQVEAMDSKSSQVPGSEDSQWELL